MPLKFIATLLLTLSTLLSAVDRNEYVVPSNPNSGPRLEHSLGDQRVLVICTDTSDKPVTTWPPSSTSCRTTLQKLNDVFFNNSYGKISYSFIVVPEVIRLKKTSSSYSPLSEIDEGLPVAQAIDPMYAGSFDRVWQVNSVNWGSTGRAYLRGRDLGIGFSNNRYPQHEIAHTNGLYHVGGMLPLGTNPFTGNMNDGNGGEDIGGTTVLSTASRYQIKWLMPSEPNGFQVRNTSNPSAVAGIVRLYDTPSQLPLPGTNRGFLFPRQPIPGEKWGEKVTQKYVYYLMGYWDSTRGVTLHAMPSGSLNPYFWDNHAILHLDAGATSPSNVSKLHLRIGRSIRTPEGYCISPLLRVPATPTTPGGVDVEIRLGLDPGNHAPTVNPSVSPSAPTIGVPVTITANAFDADGDNLSYHWRVNDDPMLQETAAVPVVNRIFTTAGTYKYQVEVYDRRGGSASASVIITVADAPPTTGLASAYGVVKRKDTGVILPGATVSSQGKTCITDDKGQYFLRDLIPGSYYGVASIRGSKAGFTDSHPGGITLKANVTSLAKDIILPPLETDPIRIDFTNTSMTVDEGQTASVTLNRSGNPSVPVTVTYFITSDRAIPGVDFTPPPGIVTFAANQTTATIPIPIHTRPTTDPDRTLTLMLSKIQTTYIDIPSLKPSIQITIRDAGTSGPSLPVFLVHPSSTTVALNNPAIFSVVVTGSPSVFWQKSTDNGCTWSTVPDAVWNSLSMTPTSSYYDNQALIRCVASNSKGTVYSNPALLTVTGIQSVPLFQRSPTNQTTVVGISATFSLFVKGIPNPTLTWQRSVDGINWDTVPGGTGFSYVTGFFYTIASPVLSENNVSIRAIAKNSAGTATTPVVRLTVVASAQIPTVSNLADVNTTIGSNAYFSCTVTGIPTPNIAWQRSDDGGMTWATIPNYSLNYYYLSPVSILDNNALFRCVASNSAGTTYSRSALLTVRSVPVITTQPQSATVPASQSASFSVIVNGYPSPGLRWQRSDVPGSWYDLASATSAIYQFTPVVADSGAQFRVIATNIYGSATSAVARLTVTTGETNHPPTGTAGIDQTIALPLAAMLAASGNDPDGDVLSFSWKKTSGPGSVSFQNPNQANTIASFSIEGIYVLAVRVSDPLGAWIEDTVQITVQPPVRRVIMGVLSGAGPIPNLTIDMDAMYPGILQEDGSFRFDSDNKNVNHQFTFTIPPSLNN